MSLDVSRETRGRLAEYAALVREWSPRINLISKGDLALIETRHIDDSLQLSCITVAPGLHWLDLGSGAGLPGLVLAILNKEIRPDARHTLIESDKRKAAFLMTAVRHFDLSAKVITERSELTTPQNADVVTARAFAPLDALLGHVLRHAGPGSQAILPKGATAADEIDAARANWLFDCAIAPSQTNPTSSILRITGLTHGRT